MIERTDVVGLITQMRAGLIKEKSPMTPWKLKSNRIEMIPFHAEERLPRGLIGRAYCNYQVSQPSGLLKIQHGLID